MLSLHVGVVIAACVCVCVCNSPTELPNLDVPPVIAPIELQAQPLPQPQNQSEEQHRGEEEMEERKEEEGRLTPACPWRQEWKEEYELHSYTPPQRSQIPTLNHRETAIHLTVTAEQRCQSLCALTPKAKTITPYQNNPQMKLSLSLYCLIKPQFQ